MLPLEAICALLWVFTLYYPRRGSINRIYEMLSWDIRLLLIYFFIFIIFFLSFPGFKGFKCSSLWIWVYLAFSPGSLLWKDSGWEKTHSLDLEDGFHYPYGYFIYFFCSCAHQGSMWYPREANHFRKRFLFYYTARQGFVKFMFVIDHLSWKRFFICLFLWTLLS